MLKTLIFSAGIIFNFCVSLKLKNYPLMPILYKTILPATISLLLLASCSRSQNKDVSSTPDLGKPFNSKKFLEYDPKKGDKKIDAFMKHLHQVGNFNGAILVAKKGKIVYEN